MVSLFPEDPVPFFSAEQELFSSGLASAVPAATGEFLGLPRLVVRCQDGALYWAFWMQAVVLSLQREALL